MTATDYTIMEGRIRVQVRIRPNGWEWKAYQGVNFVGGGGGIGYPDAATAEKTGRDYAIEITKTAEYHESHN